MNRIEFFRTRQLLYQKDPTLFFSEVLSFVPDPWQAAVAMDVAEHPRVSVRSGQGVGKTGLEAALLLWFLCCFPYPRIVATAPTRQQLNDVLWSEVAKWQSRSPLLNVILKWTKTYIYMVGMEKRWFAVARTATKAENMQGFHEENMLFIVDEASGVAEPIMEAILGTLSGPNNKLLMCGNPTQLSGTFYDSHNIDRQRYRTHVISSADSPRTNKETIDMLLEKYGAESDVARVRIYGQFPKGALDSLISMEAVEFATNVKLNDYTDSKLLHIGVDVARFGDDKTVITPRIDKKAFNPVRYHKISTMETTGHVIRVCKEYMQKNKNLRRVYIKVDDTGVGGGVTDRLREVIRDQKLPFTVVPVNNGSTATDEYYANLGSQLWGHLQELLEKNLSNSMQGNDERVIELPDDPELITQLSNRKYHMTSKGTIELERKSDMKKRSVASPDIADSLALAFYDGALPNISVPSPDRKSVLSKESYWK